MSELARVTARPMESHLEPPKCQKVWPPLLFWQRYPQTEDSGESVLPPVLRPLVSVTLRSPGVEAQRIVRDSQ